MEAPVLIIDDDPAMTEVVREILEAAGHTTAVARNAFHGLKLARETKPAAVVCDMVMPDMSGSDVFRALASDPATALIPRVMISGHINADHSCADAFLLKPFQPLDMLATLRSMDSLPRSVKKRVIAREAAWRG